MCIGSISLLVLSLSYISLYKHICGCKLFKTLKYISHGITISRSWGSHFRLKTLVAFIAFFFFSSSKTLATLIVVLFAALIADSLLSQFTAGLNTHSVTIHTAIKQLISPISIANLATSPSPMSLPAQNRWNLEVSLSSASTGTSTRHHRPVTLPARDHHAPP